MQLLSKNYLSTARIGRAMQSPSDMSGIQTVLQTLLRIDSKAPAWWSPVRDQYLRDQVYINPFLDSIVSTVTMKIMNLPVKVLSRDTGVEKYNRLAETYNDILLKSLYHNQTLEKFIRSMLIQDNGAFMYITGNEPSDSPLLSMPTGLLHLDSTLCTRTGDPEFPVVFQDYDGRFYKLHTSRIIMCSQSPSIDAEMFGVGYSFVSRAMILAQHFNDIFQYEGEILGSRSSEEIVWGTGVRSDDIRKAFEVADLDSDNAGLDHFGKRVYIGMRDSAGKIGTLRLKNLPENFQKRDDIEITLTLIALASGGSPNWFYDSVRSGSTKASASESTKIGESKLELWYINMISSELDYKFLPPSLMSLAGNFDEDNSGVRARIKLNLAQTRKLNIDSTVTDVRTERELQLQRGELSKSQFESLELKDGRISNGLPLYVLYQTDVSTLRDLLYFTENPLDFTTNVTDPNILDKIDEYSERAQTIALNARTINMQNYGLQAYYVLKWTRDQYEILLNVTPRYEFNEGEDTVVDGELMTLRNELSGLPNDNSDPELIAPSTDENGVPLPTPDNPNPQPPTDNTQSGINDDDGLDFDSMNKNYDDMFTTRRDRKYRKELRSLARDMWNQVITPDDFEKEFSSTLQKALGDSPANGITPDSYATELSNFILKNLRKDSGKLYNIYEQTDRWILWT
jgi:hypothetical protein